MFAKPPRQELLRASPEFQGWPSLLPTNSQLLETLVDYNNHHDRAKTVNRTKMTITSVPSFSSALKWMLPRWRTEASTCRKDGKYHSGKEKNRDI